MVRSSKFSYSLASKSRTNWSLFLVMVPIATSRVNTNKRVNLKIQIFKTEKNQNHFS